jgi:transposase
VGSLPIVNAFLDGLGVDKLLAQEVPGRGVVTPARALGVLLRNIILDDRQPIYTHAEWASRAEASLIGLEPGEAACLNDDRVGRALDKLFDADRGALMTELVLRAVRGFQIDLDRLHNDSTTLTVTGQYKAGDGREERGKPTVRVTYGHNKDHRPDLKQILFSLTVSADGAVPVHYKVFDGNTADVRTHVETWETLSKLSGGPDFIYVADSKLCSRPTMDHIDRMKGRFITVLPRSRREDAFFRDLLRQWTPPWVEAIRRPNPRRRTGPEDIWKVAESPVPSKEGYRVVWVWSSLMAAEDADSRQARIEAAWIAIERLATKLRGPRCRLRTREQVAAAADAALLESGARRWVSVEISEVLDPKFKQEGPGHPGPETRFLRENRRRFTVAARVKEDVILADAASDGMFPLISNCRDLKPAQILEAYKFQPRLEKRHEQLKSVQNMAPVWLKNVPRIEALLLLYFIAIFVHALIERELREGMAAAGVESLPLYPEERMCRAPCAERIVEIFAPLQRHRLYEKETLVEVFEPELHDLHRQVLGLLNLQPDLFKMK